MKSSVRLSRYLRHSGAGPVKSGLLCVVGLTLGLAVPYTTRGADSFSLRESNSIPRIYSVTLKLSVSGEHETPLGDGRSAALKLRVASSRNYLERQLPGTGRDHASFRAARYYRQATATIDVDNERTNLALGDQCRFVVAQGRADGIEFFSPDGPMTHADLDLLQVPGDSLAILALLPDRNVEVGEEWKQPSWVVQMLTGIDAVLKTELTCRLESVKSQVAQVAFEGRIEGATVGAATTVTVAGDYLFDLEGSYLKHLSLKQTEKRSVGPVSPGMDVVADVVLERVLAGDQPELSDERIEQVPLQPDPKLLLLAFDAPGGTARLLCERDWHVFHQTPQVAVLRLLDKGSLIAQCNISRIPDVAPGAHTPESQFQGDIRKSLGERLKAIQSAEQLVTDDGRFLYRVTATGEANGIPRHWIYYLAASPSGRQVSALFAVDTDLLDKLDNRDVQLMSSMGFTKATSVDD